MKKIDVTIIDDSADKGKRFRISQRSAINFEKWAVGVLAALARNGTQKFAPETLAGGAAGLAGLGLSVILSGVSREDLTWILDDMMSDIQIVPDSSNLSVTTMFYDSAIEEPPTLLKLRLEWWNLHTAFFHRVYPSTESTSAFPWWGPSPTIETSPG